MINLDDKKTVLETQGGDKVLRSINNFPKQIQQAFLESQKISYPKKYRKVKNLVVAGMGGSRFPALIIKELFKNYLTIPFIINDDYIVPEFVNHETLYILSSYSGTTEEVLINGKTAYKKGALLTGLSSGGDLQIFLNKIAAPLYVYNPIYNPSGQPRIGFGYAFGGLLGILVNLGLIKIDKIMINQAIKKLPLLMTDFFIENPLKKNPAKILAKKIFQKYPYFIVAEFLTGIGNGMANQINETAKAISSFRIIPELNHHLMEGLKFPEVLKKIAVFIFFYSVFYSPQIKKRFYITEEVVKKNNIETFWYQLKGGNILEQALELMAFGNFLSMYLAALYQQDPTTIPYVDYFKKKLKKMK
ncbi:MAG: SIS domain-containing protein [Microgenomates group bacterium]|nr:SIS domain-containing protein [Microgenomates group bacterium]